MKITLQKIFFLFTILIAGQLFSQSLGYNNHRIAISADGNNQPDNHTEAQWPRADPDDWGGTPAALAMIAKLELKHRLVHYSYNNFIEAPKHTDQTNYMADGVNGAIQRWDFNSDVFFDVPENPTVAINHLASEISKSTANDPLYFIHMGPSEFFYKAVKQTIDDGNIEALAFVQVISHSGYNDNHLRRTAHHTMQQTIDLSGSLIKYKKIVDQNACESPAIKWCSNTDFSPYYWMRDHTDENLQWLYSRLQFHPGGKGADISDAGMVYYLILGDEEGNPAKLETLIGDGIENTPTSTGCVNFNFNGVQDFEMSKIGDNVIAYKDTSRDAIAVDASIYPNKFGATQKIFEGPTGVYDVTMTTLTEVDGESTYRLRVDNELVGSFQNPVTTEDMATFSYVFRNVTLTNGVVFQIESNTHSNGTVPEGDGFAWARGRWRSIDFQCLNLSARTCVLEDNNGLFVFEAERFTLNGNWKLGTDTEKASGGKYIYYDGPNSYQTVNHSNDIAYSFNIKTPGTYTFKWTMRQPEGERGSDLGNDAWFYFSDDIAKAGSDVLTQFYKFVGRSDDDFTLNGASDINHKQSWINVTFPTAGTYTLNLSGRSHGFQLDRIVLYNSRGFDLVPDEIALISETLTCTGTEPLADPTSITLTPNPLEVRVGTVEELTVEVAPENANPEVTWTSADSSIATVDDNGNITGVKIGSTTITATSTVDNSIIGNATINVVAFFAIPVTSVTVTPENKTIYIGSTLKLEGSVNPKNADVKTLTWSSSDANIATVDANGTVTAVANGLATITATSTDGGFKDSSEITVETFYEPSLNFDDKDKYTTTNYYTGGELVVNLDFHAGSGNTVLSNGGLGVKYWLRHLDKGWVVKNDYLANDASVIGQESGTSTATISLEDAIITADLTDGDFYWLWVNFITSKANKRIEAQLINVKILDGELSISDFDLKNSINFFPNPVKDTLYIEGDFKNKEATLYNINGLEVLKKVLGSDQSLKIDSLSTGTYFLRIENRIAKFIKD